MRELLVNLGLAALFTGAGVWLARSWQHQADIDTREPGIQQFYDRQKAHMLVSTRDA